MNYARTPIAYAWHAMDSGLFFGAGYRYAENYITRKALSKETGINEQQLSHYANGQRHPRPFVFLIRESGSNTILFAGVKR